MTELPAHEPENDAPPTAENAGAASCEKLDAEQMETCARGLLKIRVAVRVTLASQRKSVEEITELGPGSIIKFDKTCDEPLELSVGDRPLARGEVVKVGDKFGLRLSGLIASSCPQH
jgi:flagellar motor switch protein FliN